MRELRLSARVYIVALALAAIGATLFALAHTETLSPRQAVLALAFSGFTMLAFLFQLPFGPNWKLSLGTSVIFAAILLFEPGIAMLTAATGTMLAYVVRGRDWDEGLFNSSQNALQAGAGGLVLASVDWTPAYVLLSHPKHAVIILVVALLRYLLNMIFVATIIGLQSGGSPLSVLRQKLGTDRIEEVAQLVLGFLLAVFVEVALWALPFLLVPAFAIYRALQAQRQSEERYRAVVEQTAEGIFLCEIGSGHILEVNAAFQRMLGYTAEALRGMTVYDLAGKEQPSVDARFRRDLARAQHIAGERRYLRRDGSAMYVEVNTSNVSYDGRKVLCCSVRDVTQRKKAEEERRRKEANLASAQRIAHLGSWEWDLVRDQEYWSDEVYRIFGLTSQEFQATYKAFLDAVHPSDRARVERAVQEAVQEGKPYSIEHRILRRDGTERVVQEQGEVVTDDTGKPIKMVGTVQDITDRKRAEELEHRAFHDPLTRLPNRALFMEYLDQALTRAAGNQEAVAVLFLDLDRFKFVNDSLGHEAGDLLLTAVAGRIQASLGHGDIVARFGGDKFTVLIKDILGVGEAGEVAERILDSLQAPFTVRGRRVFISASIGISMSTSGQDRPEDLLRDADIAMYRAKKVGKARYELFDTSMGSRASDRLELETDLRRAIEHREFSIHYQPTVELATGRVIGLEALVRWGHPNRGPLSPTEFIPLAEEIGLILPIGGWVLEEACRQGRVWQEQYADGPPVVGVNLSVRQFQRPEIVEEVVQALRESGLHPSNLQIEITESVVMEDAESTVKKLRQLKSLGVRLAVDDFGTGYSSLSYLRRLPVDMLKIDRSFIHGLGSDPADAAIVQAVITLAKTLGMQVTAEGVENAVQMAQLQALGCDLGQGYYFGEPQPSDRALSNFNAQSILNGSAQPECERQMPVLRLKWGHEHP